MEFHMRYRYVNLYPKLRNDSNPAGIGGHSWLWLSCCSCSGRNLSCLDFQFVLFWVDTFWYWRYGGCIYIYTVYRIIYRCISPLCIVGQRVSRANKVFPTNNVIFRKYSDLVARSFSTRAQLDHDIFMIQCPGRWDHSLLPYIYSPSQISYIRRCNYSRI